MRNLEDGANCFHAGFDGSSADGNCFRTDSRFQQHVGHNCRTKAEQQHNSQCESGRGNKNISHHHRAEHAIAGQHRDSNSANCFSYAADGLTDAGYCFSDSECNHDSGRSARGDCQPVRDAGYKRYRVRFDDRNSWIATSGKLQHPGNYHCSAREHGGNREPLSDDTADYESTDSEMNL